MAATEHGEEVESVLKLLNRHINCLSEENRNTRKRAIEGIRKETTLRKPKVNPETLQGVINEIVKPVLKGLSDPVEKNRELTITFFSECLEQISQPDSLLSYLIPIMVQRLGQQDIVETSEELRLCCVTLLTKMVELSGKKMVVYLDDMVKILQRTIIDPYHEVKKESCRCAAKLAKETKTHFHMVSENLIQPLQLTISHQHSRVRVETINSIGAVLQYGNGKNVDDVVSHLAQRLFDQSPSVRMAVVTVVGDWLLELLDRYSFFHKLIPLLLTGITDEVPEISAKADALWHDVGMKYAQEQEDDLKEKQNWSIEDLTHYPPNIERPNIGCRELICRHFSKVLSGLLRDLHDWVPPTRVKASQLLYTMMLNEEDNVTQHLEKLLSGLYRACGDEETVVVTYSVKCAELVGYFVLPETWVKMVLEQVKLLQTPGSLQVLAAIIRGSQPHLLQPRLPDICNILTLPTICTIMDTQLQVQLVACVEAMTTVCQADCGKVSFDLFKVLISVLALHRHESLPEKVYSQLDCLAQLQGFPSRQTLFENHTRDLISDLKDEYAMWTQHSVERLVFDTLVIESGPVVGDILEDIIPMFSANLHPDKEPEVRLKFFTLLSRLVMSAPTTLDSQHKFGEFAVRVMREMVVPNMVWKAGKTASAIRTTAVACLWALLQSELFTTERLLEVVEDVLTQLISTIEDDNKNTRLLSCRTMKHLFKQVGPSMDQDRLHNIYPELLKRLDDSSDDIRVAVTQTFIAYIDSFQDNYNASLYRAHLEFMYGGLLVHLDDPETRIQQAVLEVLKTAARLDPSLLMEEVEKVKLKHRSTTYLDQLHQHMKDLPRKD